MKNYFNRFENQCQECCCYSENAEPGEAIDPDCECSLNHDISEESKCGDFSK